MTIRSLHSSKWILPVCAAVVSFTVARPAVAERRSYGGPDATGHLVSVEVQVEGRRTPLYRAPHVWDRQYFAAEHGENYALHIRNRTGSRVGVLIAVDGLNVVNGERSALSSQEPMYVLDPFESATIRGWRTSLQHVREFVFVDEDRSYAERTGQANGDMGWVKVLAFEERQEIAPHPRWFSAPRQGQRGKADTEGSSRDAQPTPPPAPESAMGKSAEKQARGDADVTERSDHPGTGWGDRRRDPVRETWFEPVAFALDRIILRYEYPDALADLGIFVDGDRLSERERGEWRFARAPRR